MKNNKEIKKENSEENLQISVPVSKKTLKYTLIIVAFIFVMYWVFSHPQSVLGGISKVLSVLSPFIVGFCIAYIINLILIPIEKLWKRIFAKVKGKVAAKLKRPICLMLSAIIVFGVLFAVVFMVIPALKNTIIIFVNRIPEYVRVIEDFYVNATEFLAEYNFSLPELNLDIDKIGEFANNLIKNYGNNVINTTFNVTSSIVSFVINMVLGIVFSIYLLAQKEKLCGQANAAVHAMFKKHHADGIVSITALVNRVFTKFVTGQLTEAIIIGFLCFIGMLIFRMPYAAIISVLVGFTALVPIFGAFFGTAIGAFLILLEDPQRAFWFIIFIIVLQQIEGNLIYPRVVGKSVGLPGIWVLVAVTVGGGIGGITGMIFAVPICSVLYVIFKEYVEKSLNKKNKHQEQENTAEET